MALVQAWRACLPFLSAFEPVPVVNKAKKHKLLLYLKSAFDVKKKKKKKKKLLPSD